MTEREFALLEVQREKRHQSIARTVTTLAFSRCLARRRVAILESTRQLVAPAASANLLPGPKLATRVSGPWVAGPTRCGGSAARPRMALMFCRGCPAGPGCGNSRAKLPPSPGSIYRINLMLMLFIHCNYKLRLHILKRQRCLINFKQIKQNEKQGIGYEMDLTPLN